MIATLREPDGSCSEWNGGHGTARLKAREKNMRMERSGKTAHPRLHTVYPRPTGICSAMGRLWWDEKVRIYGGEKPRTINMTAKVWPAAKSSDVPYTLDVHSMLVVQYIG